jgi:shikimate dehydrogenase
MRRLGVLGWPVAHSRSPAMHNAALAALGLSDWSYQRLPVPPELFDETVAGLPASGFAGANVTIPHKEAALALATDASAEATAIGAANTLTFGDDGAVHADNTDGPAIRDVVPEGGRALVLGAGGSARAAIWALKEAGAEVTVWNRTSERAIVLAEELGAWPWTADQPTGTLVNCTAVGLSEGDDPYANLPITPELLKRAELVVDLAYGDHETALVRAARALGTPTVDGAEILVRQGARSFERWTGREAPLDVMRDAVNRG